MNGSFASGEIGQPGKSKRGRLICWLHVHLNIVFKYPTYSLTRLKKP